MEYFRITAGLSAEQLVHQIHDLSDEVGIKFNADDHETKQLGQFANYSKKLAKLALKSDFPGVPANTYRSTLRLMVHILTAAVEKMSSERDREDLFTIVYYANKWMEEIDVIEKNSSTDGVYSYEDSRRIIQMFHDDGAHCYRAFLNEHLLGINLPFPFQFYFHITMKLGPIIRSSELSLLDTLKFLVSQRKSAESVSTVLSSQLTDKIVKRAFDNMSTFCPATFKAISFLNSPIKFLREIQVKDFNEDVVSRYEIHIDPLTGSVDLRERKTLIKNRIKYYVIKSKGTEFENQVVFFVHGGGFIGPTADVYNYGFLDQLADFLPGVTIINIDHPSSAEGRFPRQIQQVLDLYIRLFSKGDDTRDPSPIPLPQNITLLGDSSGGCLIVSLAVILNDLRKTFKESFSVKMPRSLVPIYGRFFARLHIDPSQLLMQWVDVTFLNVYSFLVLGGIYSAFRKKDDNGNWYLMSHEEKIPSDWMWRPEEYQYVDHPYVSPGSYSDWESLSDVGFHAIDSSQYDNKREKLPGSWSNVLYVLVYLVCMYNDSMIYKESCDIA